MINKCIHWLKVRHDYIALTAIAITTHFKWFLPSGSLQSGDWQFRFNEHVSTLASSWNTWIGFQNLGEPNIQIYAYPVRGLNWALLSMLSVDYNLIVKLTLLIPLALGSFFIPYYVGKKLNGGIKYASFVAALIYGSTTYFLIIQTRHLFIAAVYTLAPLVLYTFISVLKCKNARSVIKFVLTFSLALFFDLRIALLLVLPCIIYLVVELSKGKVRAAKLYPAAIWVLLLFILLSVFWVAPTLAIGKSAISETADRGLFGNDLFSLSTALNVFRWSWTGGLENRAFYIQPIALYLWALPITTFILIILRRKFNTLQVTFLVTLVIALFFGKQSSQPFYWIYEKMYENFPGFSLYREASKFYLLIALSYWVLILTTLHKADDTEALKKVRAALTVCLIVVAVLNLSVLVGGKIGGIFVARDMPTPEYVDLKNLQISDKTYGRALWIPSDTYWGIQLNEHPRLNLTSLLATIDKKYYDNVDIADPRAIANYLSTEPAILMMRTASIKYVVVPLQVTTNYEDAFAAHGSTYLPNIQSIFEQELDKIGYLKRVDGFRDIAVYENTFFEDYAVATDEAYDMSKSGDTNGTLLKILNFENNSITYGNGLDGGLDVIKPVQENNNDDTRAPISLDKDQKYSILRHNLLVDRSVTINANQLTLKQSYPSLNIDGTVISTPQPVAQNTNLGPDDAYLAIDDKVFEFNRQNWSIDIPQTKPSVEILSVKEILDVDNWSRTGLSCTVTSVDDDDGMQPPFRLDARLSTACTKSKVKVVGTNLLIDIDYSTASQEDSLKVRVSFDEDGSNAQTVSLPTTSGQFSRVTRNVKIPIGAKSAIITLINPKNGTGNQIDRSIDVKSLKVKYAVSKKIAVYYDDSVAKIGEISNKENVSVAYGGEAAPRNLVTNGGFEEGLWNDTVSDCHNIDTQDAVRQDLVESPLPKAGNALSLSARSHIACVTSEEFDVAENTQYSLKLNYKLSSKVPAQVQVNFVNEPGTNYIYKSSTDKFTGTLSTSFVAPPGSKRAKIILYGLPDPTKRKTIFTTYDDISILRQLGSEGGIYLRQIASQRNGSSYAKLVGATPTSKYVTIHGTGSRVTLRLSEKFHAGWNLKQFVNDGSALAIRPEIVNHFVANGWQNAWEIDVKSICDESTSCSINHDGTYNINLVAEFTPQRYFNYGLVISGTTLAGCIGYLVYDYVIRPRRKTYHTSHAK